MALSEAQRRVLHEMSNGREVWTVSGRDPHAFWRDSIAAVGPRITTVHTLERLGLVENYQRDLTGGKYRITPAGCAALGEKDSE